MTSSQRPRPRPRKAPSSLLSPIEGQPSSISPLPLSGQEAVNGDDDFFTRKKRVPANGRTISAPTLDLNIAEDESEEEINADEDNAGSSSDGEGRRRKKARRQMSSWTKSVSFNKAEPVSSLLSPTQDRDEEDDDLVLSHDSKASRRKASRSPSLTPPPALDPSVIRHLKTVLDQYTTPKTVDSLDEEESFSIDAGERPDLDPDLVRMIRGDRAREQRKLVQEREARQRQEEELVKSTQTTTKPHIDTIEVEDSDEDEGDRRRDNASSSPVQIISFSQKSQRETPAKSASPVKRPSSKADVEVDERLNVIMKGGVGGALQAIVRVKPSTSMKKLLDHFKDTHKDAIPKGKLKSVRIRFDGDWLDPSATVADVGIEDEEQVDVVW